MTAPKRGLYDLTLGLFVAVLMISNIVAIKLVPIGPLVVTGGTLLFPLAYIFGDVLTEVYGFKGSRRVIWAGFGANALMCFVFYLVGILPSITGWGLQDAYSAILMSTPRIVLASLCAYLTGEFVNSVILSRLKVLMAGKKLWVRTITSTIAGEFFDTAVFTLIAFTGVVPPSVLVTIILSSYVIKVAIEIVFTPVTYKVVKAYKRSEGIDVFDKDIKYNPFGLSVEN